MIMAVLARASMGTDHALNGQDERAEPRTLSHKIEGEEETAQNSGLSDLRDEASSRNATKEESHAHVRLETSNHYNAEVITIEVNFILSILVAKQLSRNNHVIGY